MCKRCNRTWTPRKEKVTICPKCKSPYITEPSLFIARDTVAKAFMDLYRSQPQEFPSHYREAEYERRIKAAYPIHLELFDRLYTD
jgi:hypothetical protein